MGLLSVLGNFGFISFVYIENVLCARRYKCRIVVRREYHEATEHIWNKSKKIHVTNNEESKICSKNNSRDNKLVWIHCTRTYTSLEWIWLLVPQNVIRRQQISLAWLIYVLTSSTYILHISVNSKIMRILWMQIRTYYTSILIRRNTFLFDV